MKRLSLLLWSGCLASAPAFAASFDCTKASTAIEKLICADANLSGLDEALGRTYFDALEQSRQDDRARLRREQAAWLKYRDACDPADRPCVAARYRERLRSLGVSVLAPRVERSGQQGPQFGAPVKADNSDSGSVTLSDAAPPRDLASGAEVILVSGYEAGDRAASGTRVKVRLNRPGKKVLLVLTSYEGVAWSVDATPGTTISGILVSGYHRSVVATTAKTQAYAVKLPYAYELENENFAQLIGQLKTRLGVEKVDAFRGKYSLPSVVEISELDPLSPALTLAGPAVEPATSNIRFTLYTRDYSPVEWTLQGQKEGRNRGYIAEGKFAVSPSGSKLFLLKSDALVVVDRTTGDQVEASLPSNFPRFSWAMDVAYDTRRGIVSVISLGGEGFFYRLNAETLKWIDFRSVNNIDVFSLAYDSKLDRYVTFTDQGELLFISGEGNALSKVRVTDKLPGFNRPYDRGNSRAPRIGIAPDGKTIALVAFSGDSVKSIWQYDAESQTARLTYKSD